MFPSAFVETFSGREADGLKKINLIKISFIELKLSETS